MPLRSHRHTVTTVRPKPLANAAREMKGESLVWTLMSFIRCRFYLLLHLTKCCCICNGQGVVCGVHYTFMKRTSQRCNKSMTSLRAILGLTQSEFAKLIGVSLDTIKSIESGRQNLTRNVWLRIRCATGASLGKSQLRFEMPSLFIPFTDGRIDCMHPIDGKTEYSKAHYEHHCKIWNGSSENCKKAAKEWAEILEKLFIEAAKPAPGGRVKFRFFAAQSSLAEWYWETIKKFGLKIEHDDVY